MIDRPGATPGEGWPPEDQTRGSTFLSGKRVLLINAPWQIDVKSIWRRVASCYPSLGLGLLAACLEKSGAEVKILDMQAEPGPLDAFSFDGNPDFVGITATTTIIDNAHVVAAQVKRRWPEAQVVVGGVHATVRPREVLENPAVDFVIRGEGERSLVRLVGGVEHDGVPGLACRKDGHHWEHPRQDYIEDLDSLPLPAYHLVPMHRYRPPLGGALRSPSMAILSSRGCPGQCTYCYSGMMKKLRLRSPARVLEEIEYLKSAFGIKELTFYDDTFCVNRARVRELCRLLIDRKVDMTWSCMSRIHHADDETLELMAEAGCHMICYGVESSDPAILRNIKKHLTLEKVVPVVRMTQKRGIRVRLSFMLGNPGDTVETMRRTTDFALQARPDLVQFNITTPYPGTEMFDWAERNGYLTTRDWSRYDLWNVVMQLPTVSAEEIHRAYRLAYLRFYRSGSFLRRFLLSVVRFPSLLLQFFRHALSFLLR